MRRSVFPLFAALALAACGTAESSDDVVDAKPESDGKDVAEKADAWNSANNPARFESNFVYKYDDLKAYATGRAEQVPWPSDYWATYRDSTNVRYAGAGTLSPVEKYDKAFNGWTPDMSKTPMDVNECSNEKISNARNDYYSQLGPAAKWQHENKGNYSVRNGRDDDGDGKEDECTSEDYDGVETWWGLCHAWVPASILEPEPQKSVTVNGVEFTVSDMKALLITVYDSTSAMMLGGRCNDKELARDAQGRVTSDVCRDTNAGAFYVIATNMLGARKRAFAEDRTGSYQVWNQPVLGYRILEDSALTEAQAVAKLGKPAGTKYKDAFNSPNAVAWRFIRMDTNYISESSASTDGPLVPNIERYTRTDTYSFVLELDSAGKVVGGEWLDYSRETHPDFLWLPIRANGGNPNIDLGQVRRLVEQSRATTPPPSGGTTSKTYRNSTSASIPDNKTTGTKSTITVPDSFTVGALNVTVAITHSYIGDLIVTLTHEGKTVTLHNRQGGGTANLNQTWPVGDFNGVTAKGAWVLNVSDRAARHTGSRKSWSLAITGSGSGGSTPSSGNTKTWSNTTAASIPDNSTTGITSSIRVSNSGTAKRVAVKVNITHPYVGDLTVALSHGGSRQVLHAREGGSADDIVKTFTVPSFVSAPVNGDWTLSVVDEGRGDVGKLNNWTLEADL